MNPNLTELFSTAVLTFASMPEASDLQVRDALISKGVEAKEAARLVELIPLAFGRLLLAKTGVHFSDSFQRLLPDRTLSKTAPLTSEPLWNDILDLVQKMLPIEGKYLLLLACRSAEVHAANKLLNNGSSLKDIILTPPIFLSSA